MSVVYPSPLVNASLMWSYNRPSYQRNTSLVTSISISTTNTVYSTGKGLSLTSLTGYIYLKALLGSYQSGTATYTIYLYRSTVGIPAAGSQPNTGDVQLASFSGSAVSSSPDSEIIDAIDTISQGTLVYYYLAVSANAAVTVTIQARSSSASPPNIGIRGAINTPSLEAICV